MMRLGIFGRHIQSPAQQVFGLPPMAHFHRGNCLARQLTAGGDVLRHRSAPTKSRTADSNSRQTHRDYRYGNHGAATVAAADDDALFLARPIEIRRAGAQVLLARVEYDSW
jgi:hypothetical protein